MQVRGHFCCWFPFGYLDRLGLRFLRRVRTARRVARRAAWCPSILPRRKVCDVETTTSVPRGCRETGGAITGEASNDIHGHHEQAG